MGKKNDHLSLPVHSLKGVGPKISILMERKGIKTIEDLFYFLPIRYEDRRHLRKISETKEGEKVLIVAKVVASKSLFFRHFRKKAYEAIVDDGTGSISVKWFQWISQYLKNVCRKGNILLLSGMVSKFGNRLQMVHPDITILEDENEIEAYKTIVPVYSEIEGLKQGTLRNLMKRAFEDYGGHIKSIVPAGIEKLYGLVPLYEAFLKLQFPDDNVSSQTSSLELLTSLHHRYLERLIFEEYFLFQLALLMKRGEVKKEHGINFQVKGTYYSRFEKGLPFELTSAQRGVLKEIETDMAHNEPMNRLLQGDVGCGKTICAILAACIAIDSGYQVAFMAPTEILAEQHYLTIHRVFESMGIPLTFLRGNMGKERREVLEGIKKGKIRVAIGTHALIQEDVEFEKLGLVVIDEQHRFGVIQRKLLKEKGSGVRDQEPGMKGRVRGFEGSRVQGEEVKDVPVDFQLKTQNSKLKTDFFPDTLVMTATPIPRTLSMVVYGDLDVSIIDEMPKGRQKIWTKVFLDKNKNTVYGMIEEELKKERQVFIVYPLVEESEKVELLNAKEMAAYFQKSVFPSYRVGLLHGRMKAEEKEATMFRFKNREIDMLVCTTVIEVGIDVPNATMIVIEHAERFGLSQLHQLRGRVGRGLHPSKCILITSEKKTALATKRLKVMEETTDGFVIAEEDMKLRGPGDMLGVRQSGIPRFRVGDLVKNGDIMTRARRIAEEVVTKLTADDLQEVKDIVKEKWQDSIHLYDVA
jgi:ATP-dependent DNA helicase RecG